MNSLILIPAYNAQNTLEGVFKKIPKEVFGKTKVVIIDNNSQDKTADIAERLSKEFPIKLIRHASNLGYGASQKTGFNYALENKADCVVLLHSDGQYSPEMLPQFIRGIEEGNDLVAGSRYLGGNMLKQGMPFHRYFGNLFLTGFANLVFRAKIYSWHSGYRAYSRKALESIKFMEFSNYYEFDSEMMIGALKNKLKIKEIPIPTIYRGTKSYLNSITYGLGIVKVILKNILK